MRRNPSPADRYFARLQRWVRTARHELQSAPDCPTLRYYGSGESGWGAQTTQKAMLAFAVMATDQQTDPALVGSSREELLEEALAMLRYVLATHMTGPLACVDLAKWGHTWISVLGMERAHPAFRLLEPYLSAAERDQVAAMQLSEARWILEHFPVEAGLRRNNHPEANLWNAAFLWRIHHRYPGVLDPTRVEEKVAALVRHGFSTPSSLAALDPAILASDGEGIGPNFYDSFALHHHHYLNVGYIAICLSQIALLSYDCREQGYPEPPGWNVQGRKVWELLRLLTFPDGRLIRVGGDTRVRYSYCQDYHFLCWHYAHDILQCPAASSFYHGWIELLEREERENRSGAFLSHRCAALRASAPGYYFRVEADRAVALGLNRTWLREGLSRLGEPPDDEAPLSIPQASWHDSAHGAYVRRTAQGVMSWVWDAAEPPQGIFTPIHRSDLAEWKCNLSGEVVGMGRRNFQEIETFHGTEWSEGFATAGSTVHLSDGWITEGQLAARLARQRTACVVLGDEMYVFQSCTALRRAEVQSIKGVHLQVPNDLFNGGVRCYTSGGESFVSRLDHRTPEVVAFPAPRVEIDDALHADLLSGGAWSLYRPSERNVRLKLYRERDMPANPGTLLSEQLCSPLAASPRWIEKGERLYDVACRLSFTGAGEAKALPADVLPEGVQAIQRLEGGRLLYTIWFNAGDHAVELAPGFHALPRALSHASWSATGRLRLEPLGLAVMIPEERAAT